MEVERRGERQRLPGEPLAALHETFRRISSEPGPIPFTGGFVGYFGYDLIRLVERLPNRPHDPFDLPVALFARFDTLVVFDHAYQRVLAIANEIEDEVSVEDAEKELARLSRLLTEEAGGGGVAMPGESPGPAATDLPSLDGASFRGAVLKAKEHIAAGDIFQVVLARRWRVPRRIEPLALYRALRMVNPSPYMVLLESPDVALVGASPEMLVRKQGRHLETRPIAGTRPRGADADGDKRLAEDLLADPKERAEHVMLVDLGRNDLGRVAAAGSVRVPTFMEVEHYSHVMHLVSSVEAEADTGKTALDALLACFPAGTVSGAPKIRAMEIIDSLEPAGARALRRCRRLSLVLRRPRHLHHHPHPRRPRGRDLRHRRRRHRRRLRPGGRGAGDPKQGGGAAGRGGARRRAGETVMILMIDNYDSFTYNLVQVLAGAGAEVEVVRNDAATVDALLARAPEGIVLSPGPGRPEDAGVCIELLRRRGPRAAARRLPRPSGPGRSPSAPPSTARRG